MQLPHGLREAMRHPKEWFYVTHAYCARCSMHVDLSTCKMIKGLPYCPNCNHPLRMRSTKGNGKLKRLRWQYLALLLERGKINV